MAINNNYLTGHQQEGQIIQLAYRIIMMMKKTNDNCNNLFH